MRAFLALCILLLAAHLIDAAYFGGSFSHAADIVTRNVADAILRAIRH
jgi:hypothetical protein